MKHLFVAAVLSAVPVAAHAENWRVIAFNDEMPAIITFINTDSIVRDGDSAEVKLQYFLEGASVEKDQRALQHRRVNCTNSDHRLLSYEFYIGKALQPPEALTQKDESSAEGSIDRAIADAACGRGKYLSETIADPARHASNYFADLAYEDEY